MKQEIRRTGVGFLVAALMLGSSLGLGMTLEETKVALGKLNYVGVLSAMNEITLNPDQQEGFEAMLSDLRKLVTAEKGSITFSYAKSLENPLKYTLYGEWGSVGAFLYHINRSDKPLNDVRNQIGKAAASENISIYERFK